MWRRRNRKKSLPNQNSESSASFGGDATSQKECPSSPELHSTIQKLDPKKTMSITPSIGDANCWLKKLTVDDEITFIRRTKSTQTMPRSVENQSRCVDLKDERRKVQKSSKSTSSRKIPAPVDQQSCRAGR